MRETSTTRFSAFTAPGTIFQHLASCWRSASCSEIVSVASARVRTALGNCVSASPSSDTSSASLSSPARFFKTDTKSCVSFSFFSSCAFFIISAGFGLGSATLIGSGFGFGFSGGVASSDFKGVGGFGSDGFGAFLFMSSFFLSGLVLTKPEA